MSVSVREEVRCPHCREEFEAELWSAVNIKQSPDLREAILASRLNVVQCEACEKLFYAERFVLFHDPQSELLAFVYPKHCQEEEARWRDQMARHLSDAQRVFDATKRLNYEPVLVFGLDGLAGLLRGEEWLNEEVRVAETVCREQKIPFVTLSPAQARSKHLPRLLPHGPGSDRAATMTRDNLLAGLARLLASNPALETYADLKSLIEKTSGWTL